MKISLRVMCALSLAFSSYSFSPKFNNKRIVVKVKDGASLENSHILSKKHLFNDYYVLQTENAQELKASLEGNDKVSYVQFDFQSDTKKLPEATNPERVEPNTSNKYNGIFNDPSVDRLWAFREASRNGMNVTSAYEAFGRKGDSEVIVAVVDTGVDYNHEDLKDVMWVNQGEIPANGIDDDGNGYVDDVHGIDTLDRDSNGNATGDMMDTHNHGTHVAGTIGATQNNGRGIAGVASNVKIMGIRTVPNRGDETDVDVAESFLYAAKHGAKIINCSFGKTRNEGGLLVQDTIKHIGEKYGVLVVAAAGNESSNNDRSPKYPASFNNDNLLVVAATSSWFGSLASFSNYGQRTVDIAAPGSGIYSTVRGNRYSNMSGTSMASPNMAGLAAEVLSRNPELGPIALKELIMSNVTKLSKFSTKMVSGGLANLKGALE
ncbi:MAG: hypothetical protein CME69_05590 [Halobacteriovorax sp.]|nr:hypothetical protein [Halobacteriovorax sp.]